MGSIEEQIAAFQESESVLSPVWMVWMVLYEKQEKLPICRLCKTDFLAVSYLNVGSCRLNVVSISDIAKCRHVSEIPVFTLCRCRGRVDLENPVLQVLA